jgi:hypothetical protein
MRNHLRGGMCLEAGRKAADVASGLAFFWLWIVTQPPR